VPRHPLICSAADESPGGPEVADPLDSMLARPLTELTTDALMALKAEFESSDQI
jgi:hypothetical protein